MRRRPKCFAEVQTRKNRTVSSTSSLYSVHQKNVLKPLKNPSRMERNLAVLIVWEESDIETRGGHAASGFTNANVKSTLARAYFADTSLKFRCWVKIDAAFTLQLWTFYTEH